MCRFALSLLAALWCLAASPSLGRAADLRGPLVVITRDTSAIGGPAEHHARHWTEHSGMAVKVMRLPFDELFTRIAVPILVGAEAYDVLLIPSGWIGDLAPYLSPVPPKLRDTLKSDDILAPYRDLGRVPMGEYVAVPIDGDMHIGAYRADLFADPEHRAAYRRETGRDLAPPDTWDDYLRIAAFFHGRAGPNRQRLRGTVEAFHSAGQRVWTLVSHAAAYGLRAEAPGALFFDPDTMVPLIDSPAWARALREYVRIRAFAGLDADQIHSADVRRLFADGEAAMAIDWTDIGPLALGPGTKLSAAQVGFFAIPGSRETWNPTRGDWDRSDQVVKVPHLAFGGWVAAVPSGSPHIEDAWSFVAWLASPEASRHDVIDGSSGINPYRASHLADTGLWRDVLPGAVGDEYLSVIRDALAAPTRALDLRIPGAAAYLDALDHQMGRALSGAASAEDALTAAAAEWDFLTDRLGRGAQRRHYRSAMGLPE